MAPDPTAALLTDLVEQLRIAAFVPFAKRVSASNCVRDCIRDHRVDLLMLVIRESRAARCLTRIDELARLRDRRRLHTPLVEVGGEHHRGETDQMRLALAAQAVGVEERSDARGRIRIEANVFDAHVVMADDER
jgi:hypothetical protein